MISGVLLREPKVLCRVWDERVSVWRASSRRVFANVQACLGQMQRERKSTALNIGAEINCNTILGVPYYSYSIMAPKILF